ncbi:hypothetical protein QL285_012435 [Trifolium repens]|nr:hypothetical protein QL285_012435 [Trifolium repens]
MESFDYCKVELSTPSLCTFVFNCIGSVPALCRSKSNLSSVKHVNIDVLVNCTTEVSLTLLSWLVELVNIKSLMITSCTLKVLSFLPDLLKIEFCSLCNLKLLKLKACIGLPLSIPNGALFYVDNIPIREVTQTESMRNLRILDPIEHLAKCDAAQSSELSFFVFPTCLFSCHTLTSLDLLCYLPCTFPNSLDLPALTSLSLDTFNFSVGDDGRVEPFSTLNGLNSLIIRRCKIPNRDQHNLCISSATLVNLTIETYPFHYHKVELSTPSLCTFEFVCTGGVPALCGSTNNLSFLKHVNINVFSLANCTTVSRALLSWLVELVNIKSLIITSCTLKVLSWIPELLKVEFRSLCNLKLLKLKPRGGLPVSIPNGALYFLIQNSPSAKVEIIR